MCKGGGLGFWWRVGISGAADMGATKAPNSSAVLSLPSTDNDSASGTQLSSASDGLSPNNS